MYNPQKFSPENWCTWIIARFVFFLITAWAFCTFWYLFFITGYWFVFYKFQRRLFAFLPTREEENKIYQYYLWVFWIMVVTFFFYCTVPLKLTSEGNFWSNFPRFFFIDWEKQKIRPKRKKESNLREQENSDQNYRPEDNSVWRNLLIANEFNELFGKRYISIEFVFLIFGVFMISFGLEHWAANTKYLTTTPSELPGNYLLKYFLTTAIFLLIGGIYYSIFFFYKSYKKKYHNKISYRSPKFYRFVLSCQYQHFCLGQLLPWLLYPWSKFLVKKAQSSWKQWRNNRRFKRSF